MSLQTPSAQSRLACRLRERRARRARRLRFVSLGATASLLASCVTQQRVAIAPPPAAVDKHAPEGPRGETILPVTDATIAGASFVAGLNQRDRMRATLCLASAIYYEAATEPDEGQRAVAQVVLNRVRHPAWPNTVCGVVYQGSSEPGCQFSFACDGAMARGPMLSAWIRARRVAEEALSGAAYAPVGSSTFYHTLQVAPAWRTRLIATGIVGAHIFYRMPADAPDAALLPMRYAGHEPTPGPLPRVAPVAQLATIALPLPMALPLPPLSFVPAVQAKIPSAVAVDDRYVPGALPESTIRPEFRDSGKWIGG